MPLIVITSGHHPCRNPRVHKEAVALARAGYEVQVHAPVFSDELLEQDEGLIDYPMFKRVVTIDLRAGSAMLDRAGRRLAMERVRRHGAQLPAALGYGVRRQLAMATDANADLLIGHQETGLWVADQLRKAGKRTGVDFEDWYSEDLLPKAREFRPLALLAELERNAMHGASHLTTTSQALADALLSRYGGRRPLVVYNSFPDSIAMPTVDSKDAVLKAVWFSQRVGPGRGLESLMLALASVSCPYRLSLVGTCEDRFRAELHRLAGDKVMERASFHAPMSPDELAKFIAGHDVGFALELSDSLSRELTITNKILQYLQLGLVVVASSTAGQREVAELAGRCVSICHATDPSALAACIDQVFNEPNRLKIAARETYLKHFSWNVQKTGLLESVDVALRGARCVGS